MTYKDEAELLAEVVKGDSYAELCLVQKYRKTALFVARDFYNTHKGSGISVDEYFAVALLSIIVAAKNYKTDSKARFITYYSVVVDNALRTYDIENSYLANAKTFAGNISLDAEYDNNGKPYAEEFGDIDPLIFDKIDVNEFFDFIERTELGISKRNMEIYKLYLEGYPIKEISDLKEIPQSSVYHIISCVSDILRDSYKK